MKIFITGAGGFVAKNIRKALSTSGHHIVSASRKSTTPPYDNEKILQTDYFGDNNDDTIIPHIQDCQVAIHLVGSGTQTTKLQYHTVNQRLTENVVKWCQNADISRIIYFSGLGVSANTTLGYFISKYMAEQTIKNSSLDHIIFRPSYIIGNNNDDYLSRNLNRQMQEGNVVIPGSGKYVMQPISILDVVDIVRKSTTSNAFKNRTFDLVGPRVIPFETYVKLFVKNRTKITHMDLEEAYRRAICGEKTHYTTDDLNIMVGNFVGEHDRLSDTAGIKFRDFLETRGAP